MIYTRATALEHHHMSVMFDRTVSDLKAEVALKSDLHVFVDKYSVNCIYAVKINNCSVHLGNKGCLIDLLIVECKGLCELETRM